jgi:hypothetical protein
MIFWRIASKSRNWQRSSFRHYQRELLNVRLSHGTFTVLLTRTSATGATQESCVVCGGPDDTAETPDRRIPGLIELERLNGLFLKTVS